MLYGPQFVTMKVKQDQAFKADSWDVAYMEQGNKVFSPTDFHSHLYYMASKDMKPVSLQKSTFQRYFEIFCTLRHCYSPKGKATVGEFI